MNLWIHQHIEIKMELSGGNLWYLLQIIVG
jgi:hypothetical protein